MKPKKRKNPNKNPGGRPSQAAAAQIEARILDAAAALFFSDGYGATSIETLAAKARISKRTFYDRYADKPALFRAVVHHIIGSAKPTDKEAIFHRGSFEEILRRVAVMMMQIMLSEKFIALHRLLLSEAPRFPELVHLVYEEGTRQEALEEIAGLLKRNAKSLTQANALIYAEQFMTLVIAAPQRKLMMGLSKCLTATEINTWSNMAVSLFLKGFNENFM